jgi:hypothetical protein
MRPLTIVRLGLAGVVLAAIGVGAAYNYFTGNGEITVVAPPDAELKVSIDGVEQPVIAADARGHYDVAQGQHAIVVGDRTWDIKVSSGFFHQLLPATNQCFVRYDVTKSFYKTGADQEMTVEDRYFDDKPVDVGSSDYFTDGEFPSSIKDGDHVYFVRDVPCTSKNATNIELVDQFGE